jgi:hypothetical protein
MHVLIQNPNSPDVHALHGSIDEFCVFSRALSAEEVARLAGRKP